MPEAPIKGKAGVDQTSMENNKTSTPSVELYETAKCREWAEGESQSCLRNSGHGGNIWSQKKYQTMGVKHF